VHFGILSGTTRVAWHWRAVGQWVFWQGSAAYGGFALHGSTVVNVGGGLFNYGALGANQGIVDSNGGGVVNRRSGPGTGFGIVGTLADGQVVTISCWRNGTSHTGRWGTTAVWNRLGDGSWFSDAFAYTGVNTIGPNC
jgi:LasA protease